MSRFGSTPLPPSCTCAPTTSRAREPRRPNTNLQQRNSSGIAPNPSCSQRMRWAPLSLPWERRKQTLAACILVALPFVLLGLNLLCLFNIFLLPVYLIYVAYIWFDRRECVSGRRKSKWFRSWWVYKSFRDYFPAKFVRGPPLDPSKVYLFAAHPHGIISMSIWAHFFNDFPGSFSSYYPNINIRYVTLQSNFYIPFFREVIMRLGCIGADGKTISKMLTSGISVLLMVGGAEESLYARPGSVDLVLKKRKGFVRLALKAGAAIVPLYSFGENELYDQVELPQGSWARKAQEAFKKYTGVALPLFRGRGILQYSWGLLPRRHPIVTVMGDPIDLPKIDDPTEEDVNKYHTMYLSGLQALYERNDPVGSLNIH